MLTKRWQNHNKRKSSSCLLYLITYWCEIPCSRAWRSSCRCWFPQAWSSQRGPWACAPSWRPSCSALSPPGALHCSGVELHWQSKSRVARDPWAARPVSLPSITSGPLLTCLLMTLGFCQQNICVKDVNIGSCFFLRCDTFSRCAQLKQFSLQQVSHLAWVARFTTP